MKKTKTEEGRHGDKESDSLIIDDVVEDGKITDSQPVSSYSM